jgi:hypothetical protein
MKFEKLDTRLEMQAVLLPDSTEVSSELKIEHCQSDNSYSIGTPITYNCDDAFICSG